MGFTNIETLDTCLPRKLLIAFAGRICFNHDNESTCAPAKCLIKTKTLKKSAIFIPITSADSFVVFMIVSYQNASLKTVFSPVV